MGNGTAGSRIFEKAAVGVATALLFFFTGAGVCIAQTEDERNNTEVYSKAAPGVVNVVSVVLSRDFFFNAVPREGAGSGAIVDKRGYILTNNHVIKNARRLEVTLADGDKFPADLVGADPYSDLAVIKIDPGGKDLRVIPMADSSDLRVGRKVLAIGNPFGLGETLTTGIVSSLGRTIRTEEGYEIEDAIQTDASINPGNSGGPLLNSDGEIIGINTAILSPTGTSVGIGFAIPINIAKTILPQLIEKGYVSYPWLGVQIFPVIPGIAKILNLKVERGAMVAETVPGGPADRAGIRGAARQVRAGNMVIPADGDVIVRFDEVPVDSPEQLVRLIRERRPGDVVEARILRNNRFFATEVRLGERPQ
jgi:S1-C subfamily serine protease